jgi:hypothetical protein
MTKSDKELIAELDRVMGLEPDMNTVTADAMMAVRNRLSSRLEARDGEASEITKLRGEIERLRGFAKLAERDRIGINEDGSLDEIVLTGMAHLEQMDGSSWFLGLYRPDGSGYRLWLSAKKGPMVVSYEADDPRASSPSPGVPLT